MGMVEGGPRLVDIWSVAPPPCVCAGVGGIQNH